MPQRKPLLPVVLIVLGVLLVLGAVLIFLLPDLMQTAPPQAADPGIEDTANVERVTLEDAKAAFDVGTAVFVDVRGPAAFEAGRIPGSVLIPVIEMEARWKELDPNDWIITYCT